MRIRRKTAPVSPELLIGPEAFEVGATSVDFGHLICRSFAVIGYPREVATGWLDPVYAHPARFDLSFHIEPLAPQIASERLAKQRARLESSRRLGVDRGRLLDPMLDAAADDAAQLANKLARGEEKLFRVGLYVTVFANTAKQLQQDADELHGILSSLLLRPVRTTYRAVAGWITTSPYGIDQLQLRRSMDTSALGMAFPFSAGDQTAGEGNFYGISTHRRGLVFWDRYSQANYNAVILARSGSGKSYFTKLEVLRSLYRGVETAIIDPEGEYVRLAQAVGGEVVELGTTGCMLNPFDLGVGDDALSERALFIQTLCSVLLRRELNVAESGVIDTTVRLCYRDAGINVEPQTHRRPVPTFEQFVAHLLTSESLVANSLGGQLQQFVDGAAAKLLIGETTLRRDAHLVVFSLAKLAPELRSIAMCLVLDAMWRQLSLAPSRPRSIVVDEAWLVLAERAGGEFLFRLAKSARKRWCGIVVVSQDAADLLASDLGTAVVTNAATHILLRQAPQTIASMRELFSLSSGESSFLTSADVGEALLIAGDRRVTFKAVASEVEHKLITTDPKEALS